ncbi:MAG: hypothetical protein C4532_10840 [Candidatus Abyssobacteria bacterium SURF_17]|uniref:Uncharacterized protein n=1 Tax=Candidatus Abyssobacteria bacterium SURF_17 TaxID=2093361 RepID=A0A419EXC9_9BACT|nr:MAG: hypothetical protein C4532_10840 [Candidatus Abyssubacteria bacterium SURF_17]
MAEYFNADRMLPAELVAAVLRHVPERSRNGALIYFSEDYYTRRNAEIAQSFRVYQSDPNFGSHVEIYEALSEHYGLAVRQICKIVTQARRGGERRSKVRRRRSGWSVRGTSRRMSLKP